MTPPIKIDTKTKGQSYSYSTKTDRPLNDGTIAYVGSKFIREILMDNLKDNYDWVYGYSEHDYNTRTVVIEGYLKYNKKRIRTKITVKDNYNAIGREVRDADFELINFEWLGASVE